MKKLQYRVKQVYGKDTMYPANDIGDIVSAMTGHKTLTDAAIHSAKALGFEVERVM